MNYKAVGNEVIAQCIERPYKHAHVSGDPALEALSIGALGVALVFGVLSVIAPYV